MQEQDTSLPEKFTRRERWSQLSKCSTAENMSCKALNVSFCWPSSAGRAEAPVASLPNTPCFPWALLGFLEVAASLLHCDASSIFKEGVARSGRTWTDLFTSPSTKSQCWKEQYSLETGKDWEEWKRSFSCRLLRTTSFPWGKKGTDRWERKESKQATACFFQWESCKFF